jgi:NADP-reducing hydrogenase subunit HndB
MQKVTIEGLREIKANYLANFSLEAGRYRAKITIHMGQCGIAAGALKVMKAIQDEVAKAHITDVLVTKSSCGGLCIREPIATIELRNQAPVKYCRLNSRKIREIFREHVLGGNPVDKYALAIGCENTY